MIEHIFVVRVFGDGIRIDHLHLSIDQKFCFGLVDNEFQ